MPRYAPPTRQPPIQPALFEGRLGCSIDETATALGVQRDTVYRLIAEGRLTISKLGRRTIVHVASIQRLLDETVIAPKPRVRRHRAGAPAAGSDCGAFTIAAPAAASRPMGLLPPRRSAAGIPSAKP
jgi:excisionase family DNA binding protein